MPNENETEKEKFEREQGETLDALTARYNDEIEKKNARIAELENDITAKNNVINNLLNNHTPDDAGDDYSAIMKKLKYIKK